MYERRGVAQSKSEARGRVREKCARCKTQSESNKQDKKINEGPGSMKKQEIKKENYSHASRKREHERG